MVRYTASSSGPDQGVPAHGAQPPPLSQLPRWTQIEYDCVTGDHFIPKSSPDDDTCDGTGGKPALPGGACYQPDLFLDGSGNLRRCDEWGGDFWERPFGAEYFPDDDLVWVLAAQDDDLTPS